MSFESRDAIAIQNCISDLKDESEAIPLWKVKTPAQPQSCGSPYYDAVYAQYSFLHSPDYPL